MAAKFRLRPQTIKVPGGKIPGVQQPDYDKIVLVVQIFQSPVWCDASIEDLTELNLLEMLNPKE